MTNPTSIDWRNRWGTSWITHIRDQDPCEACWAFGATALVESMVRINHAVWNIRSEGDVHDGMNAKCGDCGSPSAALDWIKTHGIADPDCYGWPTNRSGSYFNPAPTGCGTGSNQTPSYSPTGDRSGRTVKIGDYSLLGDVNQQKTWLDTVGPLVCGFDVYQDFFSLGSGVYVKQNNPGNTLAGGHIMLIIGYNDNQNCWIVKNSWGSGWGDHGFARIGYGQCNIDHYSKIGLHLTNPDPWTKRRLHGGNMIESGNGALHRNFEMVATANGGQIKHWWRDNSIAGFPWHAASVFGNNAAACPTMIATTYNRNFELVYLTTSHRLHHWWFNQAGGKWNDGGIFGPTDASGLPGFIQGNYNAPGNFEVVVRTSDGKLNHWWRQNGSPWTWHDGGRFANNVAFSGPSLIQSHYGTKGNFELVCVLNNGQMQHWWRDNDASGFPWHAGPTFGSGISSPPCMIEGQYGALDEYRVGNFELCVAVGGRVQHWWRNNQGNMNWIHSATFGHDVMAVAGLLEGSYGFNLEVIVLRTDNKLQHYWRDGNGWHEGPIIGSA